MPNPDEPEEKTVIHGADPSSKARLRSALDIARQYAEETVLSVDSMSEEDIQERQAKEKVKLKEQKAREAAAAMIALENRKINRAFAGIPIDPISVFGRMLAWNLSQASVPHTIREAAAQIREQEAVTAMLNEFQGNLQRGMDEAEAAKAVLPATSSQDPDEDVPPAPVVPKLQLSALYSRIEALGRYEGRELAPQAQELVADIQAKLTTLAGLFDLPSR